MGHTQKKSFDLSFQFFQGQTISFYLSGTKKIISSFNFIFKKKKPIASSEWNERAKRVNEMEMRLFGLYFLRK